MHNNYQRFAVSWVPQRGSVLSDFGCSWSGWCAERGQAMRRLKMFQKIGSPGPVSKFGLHGVIVPPFRLAKGRSFWGLERVLGDLAVSQSAVRMAKLDLTVVGERVSLVSPPDPDLASLMQDLGEALSAQADDAPAAARFEVPLTGGQDAKGLAQVIAGLAPMLNNVLRNSQVISDLALLGDPGGDRPWRLIERYPLALDARAATAPSAMDCLGPHLIAPFAQSELV